MNYIYTRVIIRMEAADWSLQQQFVSNFFYNQPFLFALRVFFFIFTGAVYYSKLDCRVTWNGLFYQSVYPEHNIASHLPAWNLRVTAVLTMGILG